MVNEIRAFACQGKDEPLAPWSYTPRPLGPTDIEVKIEFCGICASDIHTLDSGWGPTDYPVVVGHEIVGTVVAAGPQCRELRVGDRVGVGAQCWACLESTCKPCSAKDDNLCPRRVFTYNARYEDKQKAYGGYAEAVRVAETFAFKLPDQLPTDAAAPLLCAGATVFNPMRRFNVGPGSRVGVVGIGGLGHLAIQFAHKLGATVVAVSHSPSKKQQCQELGAKEFVCISDQTAVKSVSESLDMLIVTSNHHGQPWDVYLSLLATHGKLVLLAVPEEPLTLNAFSLLIREVILAGSLIGSRALIQDMLQFSADHQVLPWIEKMPIQQVNEALTRVREGNVRYRIVLEAKF